MSREERVLVDGCRRGDERAWLALYRAYSGDIGLFLRGMLREAGEIDDLVQKVFLEFLATLERFRGDAALRTWLHRIARHVALTDLRRRKRQRDYVKAYAETVDRDGPANPESTVQARDRLAVIQGILTRLDDSFQEVWVLRELQGFSVDETAVILKVRPGTVRTRHHRARQRILECLRDLDSPETESPGVDTGHLKILPTPGGGS